MKSSMAPFTSKKRLRTMDLEVFQQSKKFIHEGMERLSMSEGKNNTWSMADPQQAKSMSSTTNNKEESEQKIEKSIVHPFGEGKYGRKVDFLIDELIRKSRRTLDQRPSIDCDGVVPSSIGPQPTTDHLITHYWPIIMKDKDDYNDSSVSSFSSSSSFTKTKSSLSLQPSRKELISFSKTHTDWIIEDLDGTNYSEDGDNNMMAVESSESASTSDSDDDLGLVIN